MDLHALAVRAVIGPLWARWEKSPYLRHYRALCRRQYDDPETIRRRQWRAVVEIARHAAATVPFYAERFRRAGIGPNGPASAEEYGALPVLTKADIRAEGEALIAEPYRGRPLQRRKTSGSTGVSLEVFIDEASQQWKRACLLRSDEWSGWRFGEPVAAVWGNPEYLRRGWRGRLRNAVLERARYLDTLHMDEAALARFADDLVRRPTSLIFGHAHSVYLFAEFLRRRGETRVRPQGVIATAMVLHEWQRRVAEEVFGCRVTNRYGCEEVSLIACECERHEGLHVNADSIYVEVVRDGRPVAAVEPGSIVVTDLTNRAMPILRYKIGDVAVAGDRKCPCGRGLPLIERVEGREADYVVTPSGALISGISLTENFAGLIPGLEQLQIVQEAVDRFRFRVVRGPGFGPASEAKIAELVAERFGPGVGYDCEYVERIPQEPSGKYRFCISKVPNPFTQTPEEALAG